MSYYGLSIINPVFHCIEFVFFNSNPSGLDYKDLIPRPLLLKEKGRCVVVYVTDYYIFNTTPPSPPRRRRWRMRSFIVHP
jgi:hypothetical protein